LSETKYDFLILMFCYILKIYRFNSITNIIGIINILKIIILKPIYYTDGHYTDHPLYIIKKSYSNEERWQMQMKKKRRKMKRLDEIVGGENVSEKKALIEGTCDDMENVGGQKWPQISRDVDSLQFACGCMSLWAPSIKPLFP
jgi:hypothetical protein